MHKRFFPLASFCLVLCWTIAAGAQSTEEYLRDNPYLGVEDGGGASGSDDSTVGSASLNTQATLAISPSSMDWGADVSSERSFTVTNNGGMGTSNLSVSVEGGGYTVTANACSRLEPGANCEIRLRPNPGGDDLLIVEADFGGRATASLKTMVSGPSCLAILQANPGLSDGVYYLEAPDGSLYQAWCNMTDQGGGWTLVMRLSTSSGDLHYDASQWTSTALLNEDTVWPATQGQVANAKFPAFNYVSGSVMRARFVRANSSIDGYDMIYPRMSGRTALQVFSGGRDMLAGTLRDGCNGPVLASVPGYDPSFMNFGKGHQFFGINHRDSGASVHRVRFGWGSNDETWTAARGDIALGETVIWQGRTYHFSINLRTTRPDCAACGGCYGSGAQLGSGPAAANLWVR